MKKSILFFAFALTSSLAFAQESTLTTPEKNGKEVKKLAAGIDVVTANIWRGIKLNSNKIAFQPYVSYAPTEKLTIGVLGSTNLSNAKDAYNEFDWYVSYAVTPTMTIMVSDYYYNATKKANEFDPVLFFRNSYFKYDANSPHVMDFSLLFNFTDKGVPLDFQWNTLFYGNDFKSDGTTRAFSSYSELGYTCTLENSGIDLRAFVGAAIINPNGYYGVHYNGKAGFSFTNVGLKASKDIKFSDKFVLPIFIRYSYNDDEEFSNVFTNSNQQHFISGGMTFEIK